MRVYSVILLLFAVSIYGCKKSDSSSNNSGSTSTPVAAGKTSLLFPAQNSVCTTGIVISTLLSGITFSWTATQNTTSYELHVKNLTTNAETINISMITSATVNLSNGTPYSWYIISKNADSNINPTQSDTWKFYVSGDGVLYYAPFPVTIVFPIFNQSVAANAGNINLNWTGSDADNDIVAYDVYFGNTAIPAIYKTGVTDMFLNNISVKSGSMYYWKVVTKDSKGNTSDSGIYQFTVR